MGFQVQYTDDSTGKIVHVGKPVSGYDRARDRAVNTLNKAQGIKQVSIYDGYGRLRENIAQPRPQNKHLQLLPGQVPLERDEQTRVSRNRSRDAAALDWWAALTPEQRGQRICDLHRSHLEQE